METWPWKVIGEVTGVFLILAPPLLTAAILHRLAQRPVSEEDVDLESTVCRWCGGTSGGVGFFSCPASPDGRHAFRVPHPRH